MLEKIKHRFDIILKKIKKIILIQCYKMISKKIKNNSNTMF